MTGATNRTEEQHHVTYMEWSRSFDTSNRCHMQLRNSHGTGALGTRQCNQFHLSSHHRNSLSSSRTRITKTRNSSPSVLDSNGILGSRSRHFRHDMHTEVFQRLIPASNNKGIPLRNPGNKGNPLAHEAARTAKEALNKQLIKSSKKVRLPGRTFFSF